MSSYLMNIRIHPSLCYRIRCGFEIRNESDGMWFFPLWRVDLKICGFAVEFAGCVWTVAVSGKKKLRIQKYPDTCRRGLSQYIRLHLSFLRTIIYPYLTSKCTLWLKKFEGSQRNIPLVILLIARWVQKCYRSLDLFFFFPCISHNRLISPPPPPPPEILCVFRYFFPSISNPEIT